MSKQDYDEWKIRVGKPFYAAVYGDGSIVSSAEEYIINTTENAVRDELKMWRKDPKTVSIRRVKIVEEEAK